MRWEEGRVQEKEDQGFDCVQGKGCVCSYSG